MWAKCISGRMGSNCASLDAIGYNWEPALLHASTSNLAEYNDWRLPNIKELASIIEESCEYPAANESVFPGVLNNSRLWSSSPYAANTQDVWYIEFADGADMKSPGGNLFYVRLVRGGK